MSRAIAVVATALAAVFGVVFAHDSAAATKTRAQVPEPTATTEQSSPTTAVAPETPTLQPPAQAPAPAQNGDGAARSGAT